MPCRADLYTLISLYSPESVGRMISLEDSVWNDVSADPESARETIPSPNSATVPAPKVAR